MRIVGNPFPLQDHQEWQFAESPALDIGLLDGDPAYQLYRVCGTVRLDDGTVIVGNSGDQDIRWFDARGVFLKRTGGEGGGPGEFTDLRAIRSYRRDSLLAWDLAASRVTIFHADGSFGRTVTLESDRRTRFVGAFADGSLLFEAFATPTIEGVVRRPRVLLRYGSDGEFIDTLGAFPDTEVLYDIERSGAHTSISGYGITFARRTTIAPTPMGFYAGTQDRYEIDLYDLAGTRAASVRLLKDVVPVTDEVMELRHQLYPVPDSTRRRSTAPRELPHAESMPAYRDILVDVEGNLWVKEYSWRGDPNRRWTVFDSSHRVLAVVEMPTGFRVHQIGADFALGVWYDELGVEHVRLYDLIKP